MSRLLFLFYFLPFSQISFGQNLIPNPSLEDENTCQKYQEQCAPKAWRSNTLKAFLYYDYKISRQDESVMKPAKGSRCISLRMFNTGRKMDRSYVQVPFLCQLEKGKRYKLQFQFLSTNYFVNSFGFYMTDTLVITKKNDPIFEKKPQIKFEFSKPFSPNKWITLETIYEATGNEIGMILGNFKRDDKTVISLLKKKKRKDRTIRRVYHYFDDFSLTPLENLTSICDLKKNRNHIYADSVRHSITEHPHSVRNIKILLENFPLDSFPKNPISQIKKTPQPNIIFKEKKNVLPNVLFETNNDILLPIAYNSLDDLIVYLMTNRNFKIKITGHTDSIGNTITNQILSQKRARSVGNYLISNGIHFSRIKTIGKGESQPTSTNETSGGQQINRRVEFEIMEKF
ncbi:MAG: OmpA family protein [Saprospiraceae bacterium]|nr:OmpA family protein [bacterium]MDG1436071.1 OmpA family protein [Saprospiraceae bacterium]MDG2417860.1 OmpA family protein [Saprospiraceae bacterium]